MLLYTPCSVISTDLRVRSQKTPVARSSKSDEITFISWNLHVLASSSSTGYTVIWDLRNKREVVALAYSGAGQVGIIGGGGRRGIYGVA